MRRVGIQPRPAAPPVDFPHVDVETFSQVPLEERWQLMAGALNRLAALEEGTIVSLISSLSELTCRLNRLDTLVAEMAASHEANARAWARLPPEVTPPGMADGPPR